MSILSNIRDFGSSVVSGIGDIFHTSPTETTPTIVGPQQNSTRVSDLLVDSVFSRVADWISPEDRPVQTTSPSQPQVVFVPTGGGASTGAGSGGKIFGIPQETLLVVLGGVVAFLILKRN